MRVLFVFLVVAALPAAFGASPSDTNLGADIIGKYAGIILGCPEGYLNQTETAMALFALPTVNGCDFSQESDFTNQLPCPFYGAQMAVKAISGYGVANDLDLLDGFYLPTVAAAEALYLCHKDETMQVGMQTHLRSGGTQDDLDTYHSTIETLQDVGDVVDLWGQYRVRNTNYAGIGWNAPSNGEFSLIEYRDISYWFAMLQGSYDTTTATYAAAHKKLMSAAKAPVELFAATTVAEGEPRVAGTYEAKTPIDFDDEAAEFCAKTASMPCSVVEDLIRNDDGLPFMMMGQLEYKTIASYPPATYTPYVDGVTAANLCSPHTCACGDVESCTAVPGCGWWDGDGDGQMECQIACSDIYCGQCLNKWWCDWEAETEEDGLNGCQWVVGTQKCEVGRTGAEAHHEFALGVDSLMQEIFDGFAFARCGGEITLNLAGHLFNTTETYNVVQFPSRREWFEGMVWAPQSLDVYIHQEAATTVNQAAAQTVTKYYDFVPWDQAGLIHNRTGENCGIVSCDYESAKDSATTVRTIGCDVALEAGSCPSNCATELCNLWACADNPPQWLQENHNAYAEIKYFADLTKVEFGYMCAVAFELEPWAAASSLSPMMGLMSALIAGAFLLL